MVARLKILFIASLPSEHPFISSDEEFRAIQLQLRGAEKRRGIVLKSVWAARLPDVIDAILRERPDVIHFSCHGSRIGTENELFLMADNGKAHPVSYDALLDILSVTGDSIRLAVFNTCAVNIKFGNRPSTIDFIIHGTSQILDRVAVQFASSFYTALSHGQTVLAAYTIASYCARAEGHQAHSQYHLLVRDGASPENIVLLQPRNPFLSAYTRFQRVFAQVVKGLGRARAGEVELARAGAVGEVAVDGRPPSHEGV